MRTTPWLGGRASLAFFRSRVHTNWVLKRLTGVRQRALVRDLMAGALVGSSYGLRMFLLRSRILRGGLLQTHCRHGATSTGVDLKQVTFVRYVLVNQRTATMLSVAAPLRGSYEMQCLKFGLSHVYLPCKITGMSGCCMRLNRYRRLRDLCYCYPCGGYGIYAMRSYTINQPRLWKRRKDSW